MGTAEDIKLALGVFKSTTNPSPCQLFCWDAHPSLGCSLAWSTCGVNAAARGLQQLRRRLHALRPRVRFTRGRERAAAVSSSEACLTHQITLCYPNWVDPTHPPPISPARRGGSPPPHHRPASDWRTSSSSAMKSTKTCHGNE